MIERTYRVSDVVNEEFLRFPLTLLANPQYREMSLEAKFVYTLLLNRLTLSQKNGWINADSEVYLIYTREEAAVTLNISYKKAIAAFKELIEHRLLVEQRQGRGYPNLLYVLKAELADEDAAEFLDSLDEPAESSVEESGAEPYAVQTCQNGTSRPAETAVQDLSKPHIKTCQNGSSRPVEMAVLDLPKRHPKKIENIHTENIQSERSPSVRPAPAQEDGATDEDILQNLFERCELYLFRENIQAMFRAAIERLYYSDVLKIGNARLPQETVRGYLGRLDADILMTALESMKRHEGDVTNPTAYLMSVLVNGVCEQDSGLILDLPPSYQKPSDFYAQSEGGSRDAPE